MATAQGVTLKVPQNPFDGKFPDSYKEISKKVNRSDNSVNLNVSADLQSLSEEISPKYARFYLEDANGNPVNPTGKLTVKYGDAGATPCPETEPEKGFYIYQAGGANLTANISVQLESPNAYKLYKVVCLFSDGTPEVENGNITKEPDFNYQYVYSFTYEDLKADDTKVFSGEVVEWKLQGMTPSASNFNPDTWGTISSAELAVERYVKWYVEKGDEKQLLAEYTGNRIDGNWTISGYTVSENIAGKMEKDMSSFPICTIYAPAGSTFNDVKDCQIVCEIYANSTGKGSPNARYFFKFTKSFLGELKNPTKKGGELITLKDNTTHPAGLNLSKVTAAWGSASRPKYARIWLTTSDGTMVDPIGKLTLSPAMTLHSNATYGYYLTSEAGINLNAITATLTLDAGVYDHYQVHVALSTEALPESKEYEPDYDYLYTFSFGYPWKTRYKTLIINNEDNPTVTPILISNWFELAGDCGVDKQGLANNLYVRWYLADENGKELSVNIKAASEYTNIDGGGFYKNKGFSANYFDERGRNTHYNISFTLWGGWGGPSLPSGYDYKNVRLVCVATTKTNGYNVNGNWQKDPDEIQVKYVYTLKTKDDLKTFAHYEGEAYRYLKEIGDDNQAKDYDYIEVDGSTPADNFTWNLSTNGYNATPDTRNIRQNVHTVDYYYYVETSTPLTLPLQEFTGNGSSTEPRAYFRWYDYKTDRHSKCLDQGQKGTSLQPLSSNGQNYGLFAFNLQGQNSDPKQSNIGVTFTAPNNFNEEILIACDVSRYMDGMDESFGTLVHEPTLSIRYLFHIKPAKAIADEIKKAGSLTNVEKDIMDNTKGKPSSILEDEGRMVVSTNDGYGEFALRTKLSSLDNYYYYVEGKGDPQKVNSLWWYVYYYDGRDWWRHLIPNRPYRDRDGRPSYRWNPKTAIYRTQSHQAKYSLRDKQWPDININRNPSNSAYDTSPQAGDFKGTWQKRNGSTWEGTYQEPKSGGIGVGDRVQMVACVDEKNVTNENDSHSGDTKIMPIIWTELEFIDARPLTLETILAANENSNKSIYERTAVYMNDHYGDENKKPKALLDFNEFSLLGMKKPTHSYENYATVPLHYPNAQYGFIYPQLYGYCATMRFLDWGTQVDGYFGMAAMHGDYTLLKSMNMQGISRDKNDVGFNGQSIQVDWVNGKPLFDVTHERANQKNTPNSNDYGGFIYVDAADEARTIASLEFETELCKDAKIYYTAYVASMTGYTRSKEDNGGSTDYNQNTINLGTPQTAPSLRFRVSTTKSGKNDGTERIPVVTFVTGNIRQEVSYKGGEERDFKNDDEDMFKEAQWYQVYGYTTIPEGAGFALDGSKRHFFVEIDNYCDNTDGADYCVDQISFYTDNCKVSVVQAAQKDCNDKDSKLNIYVQTDGIENITAEDGYIYWRICDNLGNPLTNPDLYGKLFLVEGNYEVPFGRTFVTPPGNVPENKTSLGDDETSGYFYMDIDGKKQLCFSLAYMSFDLMQGSNHYISVYSKDHEKPSDGKNAQGWGNQKDPCTVYSKIFIPKVMYVSIAGLTGGSTPPVDGGCPAGAASLVNFDIVLNVPDTNNKETGFTPYPNVPFDFFKGTIEELQGPKYGEGDNKFSLEYAINYYRNYADIAKKDGQSVGWDYDCNHREHDGLDPKFGEDESAEYYKYYLAIKEALDANKLYLSYSSTLSNLTVEEGNSTIWAISAKETMKDNNNEDHFVCSPLPLNFVINDKVQHPDIMLGFGDVTYQKNLRVIRVGKKQLEKMQEDGFLLHIPVNDYTASDRDVDKGKLGIISGGLELLAYNKEIKGTDDPDVKEPKYVAAFDGTEISNSRRYISLKFHGQYWNEEDEKAEDVVKYQFKEGFTYRMSFQVKNGAMLDSLFACEYDVEFLMKVVPEYVTWNDGSETEEGKVTGTNQNENTNWNNDKNWSRSRKAELHKTVTNTDGYQDNGTNTNNGENGVSMTPRSFVPMKFTYVTIPSGNKAPRLVKLTKDNVDIIDSTSIDDINVDSERHLATDSIEFDMMVKIDAKTECEHGGSNVNVYDLEKYYGNVCKEIYFKPGAELVHQQFLTYEKAWVEMKLDRNKWYLLSAPLKGTYAGDMYVPAVAITDYSTTPNKTVIGQQVTEAFTDIEFENINDNGIYSRTQYPIYQRSWDHGANGEVITTTKNYSANLQFSGEVSTEFAQWTHTYNDMEVQYDNLQGFVLRAHKKDGEKGEQILLRLPKADKSYTYYDYKDDPASGTTASTLKDENDYGRFVTDDITGENKNIAKIAKDLTENNNKSDLYYLVGNPYMASLDMTEFFKENPSLTGAYWTVTNGDPSAGLRSGKVGPMEAFFVKVKESTTPLPKIVFTSEMMMDGNYDNPTQPTPAPALTMTASNGRGQSSATLSVGEEARSVETLFDSNLEDVPMVYTVADGQAVSIQQLTELSQPVAFGVTCAASNDPVEVTFTDIDQLTGSDIYVVDAVTGSQTAIGEGDSYTVQPNDYGRYFLLAGTTAIDDKTDVAKGIMVSVRGREVTVTSSEELTQVHALTLNGTTHYEATAIGTTTTSFTLSSGVYVIKTENVIGEKMTVKIIVK